ncbi:Putative cytosolic protein (plasmid) [Borrelia nietonii YOR]|uniref:Putative cytosolic protein n=1 Tax=Borrelia nietonii YOR TaxID=1293576 RepID=W5SC86_9SPIR|nr:Putative cytosolic protein [Borrelia nietonii YOR]
MGAVDIEIPFEEKLSMRKGKVLENLSFDEFVRMYGDEVAVFHKNKYANGIDKYNYFKRVKDGDNLVGSTIDGWFAKNNFLKFVVSLGNDFLNVFTSFGDIVSKY